MTGGITNFKEMIRRDKSAGEQILAFLNTVRARALSQTRPIIVRPLSHNRLVTYRVSTCDESPSQLDEFNLELPNGTQLENIDWRICFNSKGLSDASGTIRILEGSKTTDIQVALGGVARIVQ